ncbi:hypothetical protein V5O48_009927 [Marasmius crinis-equi]|uniref:Uncharacterized protein n=1 Tax=Marasmius crinis-equi TaxID=585013 RepID=A0ABR3FAC9_9AGAR
MALSALPRSKFALAASGLSPMPSLHYNPEDHDIPLHLKAFVSAGIQRCNNVRAAILADPTPIELTPPPEFFPESHKMPGFDSDNDEIDQLLGSSPPAKITKTGKTTRKAAQPPLAPKKTPASKSSGRKPPTARAKSNTRAGTKRKEPTPSHDSEEGSGESKSESKPEPEIPTIGCEAVTKKPEDLTYKFSTTTAKADPMKLGSAENWTGCVEDALDEMSRGKKISITISPGQWYLDSLQKTLKQNGKKKANSASGSRSQGQKNKASSSRNFVDLNDSDASNDEGGSEELMEGEKKQMTQLDMVLSKCQKCGPSVFCKVDKHGSHVGLTFSQRRAWAVALALGTHGVALKTPPKSDDFMQFHATSSLPETTVASTASTPQSQFTAVSDRINLALTPLVKAGAAQLQSQAMNYYHPDPSTPTPASRTQHAQYEMAAPSSNLPNYDDIIPFPEIQQFLMDLQQKKPMTRAFPVYDRIQGSGLLHG